MTSKKKKKKKKRSSGHFHTFLPSSFRFSSSPFTIFPSPVSRLSLPLFSLSSSSYRSLPFFLLSLPSKISRETFQGGGATLSPRPPLVTPLLLDRNLRSVLLYLALYLRSYNSLLEFDSCNQHENITLKIYMNVNPLPNLGIPVLPQDTALTLINGVLRCPSKSI